MSDYIKNKPMAAQRYLADRQRKEEAKRRAERASLIDKKKKMCRKESELLKRKG